MLVPVSDVMSVCFPGAVRGAARGARVCTGSDCPGLCPAPGAGLAWSYACTQPLIAGCAEGRSANGPAVSSSSRRLRLRHVDARHPLIAQLVVLILD